MTNTARPRRRCFAAAGFTMLLLAAACGQDDPDLTTTARGDGSVAPPVVVHVASAGGNDRLAAPEASGTADAAMIGPWVSVEYVVGATLPEMPAEANGWQYRGDVTPDPAAVRAVADALDVTGDLVEVPADMGGGWRIGPDDGSAPAIYVSADGQLSWWYSPAWTDGAGVRSTGGCVIAEPAEPATDPEATDGGGADSEAEKPEVIEPVPVEECVYEEPVPPTGVPSGAEAEAEARSLLAAMGVDGESLVFETYADEWTASVTAYLRFNGVKAPVAFAFGFGAEGRLDWANGLLATPVEVGPYPLVSVDDALQRLRDGYGGWGYPMPLDVAVDAPAVGAPDIAVDAPLCDSELGDCVPIEPEEITVTIVDVRLDLWWVWDTDGTVWLLPAYSFVDADGGTYTVPAVTDEYLVVDQPEVTEPGTEPPGGGDPGTEPPGGGDPGTEPPGGGEPGTDPTGGAGTGTDPTEPGGEPGTEPDPDGGVVSNDPDPVDPGTEPAPEPTPIPDEQARTLIGLTEAEATALAEANGWTVRVVARDGESFAVTEDYGFSRVNLVIVNDIVTEVTVG